MFCTFSCLVTNIHCQIFEYYWNPCISIVWSALGPWENPYLNQGNIFLGHVGSLLWPWGVSSWVIGDMLGNLLFFRLFEPREIHLWANVDPYFVVGPWGIFAGAFFCSLGYGGSLFGPMGIHFCFCLRKQPKTPRQWGPHFDLTII